MLNKSNHASINQTEKVASRLVSLGDWIFEVKMVRAIRVPKYGEPYSAIANININGDSAYVDGLMTQTGHEFTRADADTIKRFLTQLGLEQVQFERYKNDRANLHSLALSVPSHELTKHHLARVS